MTESTETADIAPAVTTPPTAPAVPARRRFATFGRTAGGIAAIGIKELRGRMRGWRAFATLTIYLALLGGFALIAEGRVESNYTGGFGTSSAFAGAAIGQGVFAAMLMLMTLLVVFLAPSLTTGSISLEREKQTLDLLMATPVTSVAIVIGKILSALVYVLLLIAASIPLMAVVFVYGGVGPEDVVRGYLVLVVAALAFGSFGLLCSSIVKRTTAATAMTIFGVLAVTVGTMPDPQNGRAMGGGFGDQDSRQGLLDMRPPALLVYLNPFVAQADVMCGTETTFGGGWCAAVNALVPTGNGIVFGDRPVPVPMPEPAIIDGKGVMGDDMAFADRPVAVSDVAIDPAQVQPFDVPRDELWPKSVLSWLILSAVFLLLSVQAVSPTRRWRLRRGPRMTPAPPRTAE